MKMTVFHIPLLQVPVSQSLLEIAVQSLFLSISGTKYTFTDHFDTQQTSLVHHRATLLARFSALRDVLNEDDEDDEDDFLEMTPDEMESLITVLESELSFDWGEEAENTIDQVSEILAGQTLLLKKLRNTDRGNWVQ